MTARLKGRRREAERLLGRLTRWGEGEPTVKVVLLVGSYARGSERLASDLDVMILSDEVDRLADSEWFPREFHGARHLRDGDWGPVRERRYRLRSGLQVELDFAPVSWAAVPLDTGTRRVLEDGHRVLYDPSGVVAEAVAITPTGGRT